MDGSDAAGSRAGGLPPRDTNARQGARATSSPRSSGRKWGAIGLSVALAGTVILIWLVAGEFALRWVGLGHPVLYTTNLTSRYELAPNQNVRRFDGTRVVVDSMGLRSVREWTQPANRKILFFGDSVTYGGSYVDTADLFSERTCAHLELGGTSTCGNAGVNAYGTDNITARLRYKPFDDEAADVVTIVAADAIRGLTDVHSLPYFTQNPLGPFTALSELAMFELDRVRFDLRYNRQPVEQPANIEHQNEVAAYSLDHMFEALLAQREKGKAVLVIFSPLKASVNSGLEPFEEFVLDRVRGSGFDYMDMTPLLRGQDLDALYHDKIHLAAAGHEFYGEKIAGRLVPMLH